MGTFYPTAQRPEMRKISSPAQLSPVKVYLHNGTGDQGSGRFDPPNANGHVPRPPWSTTQALTMIPQQVPHQTPPLAVLKDPISHQKLADQVAQKAIENQAQQEQIRQKYKESRVVGVAATPKSTVKESVHYYAPPISRSPQPQEQYVYQQQYTLNQDFPQALNYQRAISPKTPSRDESLERRMKVTKLHDPGSWVVQESVTESQMVKGAPWARYQLEKKERVWPPASPKLVQGSADYAPNYEKQRYETESANPFQRKYPDIYEEQEKKHVLQTSAAPSYQHYGESSSRSKE
uniref:Zasp-like motif domain-containing protein n=1 Tax=Romanomermis culicivorax TaxID=13658 RepID=A0A915KFC5_ROMCU